MEKKVLIVDDSNTNNFLLQSILMGEGIESFIALNGKEAFKAIHKEKPNLILLDIMMPELDGFSVLNQLKKNPETNNIPVLFVTARNEENLRQKALEAGALDLIQKPIDVNQIIKLVKTALIN